MSITARLVAEWSSKDYWDVGVFFNVHNHKIYWEYQ
ncbi:hypothetical protein A2U01_0076292, partial [Trifolium medium]|nr:hypothetical protein [Trifolium medium]